MESRSTRKGSSVRRSRALSPRRRSISPRRSPTSPTSDDRSQSRHSNQLSHPAPDETSLRIFNRRIKQHNGSL